MLVLCNCRYSGSYGQTQVKHLSADKSNGIRLRDSVGICMNEKEANSFGHLPKVRAVFAMICQYINGYNKYLLKNNKKILTIVQYSCIFILQTDRIVKA